MKTLSHLVTACLILLSAGVSSHAADKPLTIAVIPKGTTHEFWKSINAGAFKARDELRAKGVKIDIIWKGPLKEDDRDQQIQTVENFMTRQVSGIVLAPLDSQALVKPVQNAVDSKVPVVIIDSGLKTDKYVSFVATDNYKGGVFAAEYLGKLLNGKGNAILLRYAVGSASTEEREAGFLDTLKSKFPEIKLISSDQYAGATRETAYVASQNLLNRFGREVNGIFCPNENSTIGMTKALRDIGKAGGKVKMVGFDSGTQSVLDLKKGDVQGLVVQNPIKMGYLGVMTIYDHLQGKKVEKRIDTGVVLATPENMNTPEINDLLHPPIEEVFEMTEFHELAQRWYRETGMLSMVHKKAMHPAYQRIIGMGEKALPFIFQELKDKRGDWLWALCAITGNDAAKPDHNFKEALDAWLTWGEQHGYL